MLKLTEEGQSSLDDLTEIRRVYREVSRYEFLMGDEHYNAVQDAFFAAMRNFESELIEGIYDANDLERGRCDPIGEQGRSASEVH